MLYQLSYLTVQRPVIPDQALFTKPQGSFPCGNVSKQVPLASQEWRARQDSNLRPPR